MHAETKSGLKLIDELRAEIRAGMAAGTDSTGLLSKAFNLRPDAGWDYYGTRVHLAVLIGRPMRRQSETLLILPLLPIFFLGMFPVLLFGLLGFGGLGLFGILLICVGLADGLQANCDFNRQVIIQGYARPSERAVHASNLHAVFRIAVVLEIAGVGLIIVAVIGLFA